MFKTIIANKSGFPVCVDNGIEEEAGLVVATRPLKVFDTRTAYFTNETYGREMAQNAAFGGTPLLLHDGTDTAAWAFSEPVGGKWTENSGDRYYAGAASLKCDNSPVGDIMQVINNVGPGDNIDMTGNYTALTMWINVDKDWKAGDSVSFYAHIDGALAGNKIYLEEYFSFSTYDTWQYINIPLADMGINSSSIDAFRFESESNEGKSPKFYVDEMHLQASGAPIDYSLTAEKDTWFHIKAFQTTFVDVVSADNEDSTMPHLSYDKILAMTPTTGYLFKRFSDDKQTPDFETRITNILDLLSLPYSTITNAMSDGTNTMITILNAYPDGMFYRIKSENSDKIMYSIEDDFSALLYFRISVQGYVEQR